MAIPQPQYPILFAHFWFLQWQTQCMIKFSGNSKLCLGLKLKSGPDFNANGSVTLGIWQFEVFVFLTKIQSYAFVPKLIHVDLKAISQPNKSKKSVLPVDKSAQFLIIQNMCIKSMYRFFFESVYEVKCTTFSVYQFFLSVHQLHLDTGQNVNILHNPVCFTKLLQSW